MNSSRGITVVITLMAAGPALSLAQHLGPGDWVRVHTVGSPAQKLVGTVVAVDAESISLRVDPDTQATIVPKRAITRIEVSQGFDSALKAPVAAGAFGIAALAAGTYFGAADKSNKSTGSQILGGVLGFLVAGVAVGEVFEHMWPKSLEERWRRIPLDQVHVGFWPQGTHGLTLSVLMRL